jgi:hypothetical protein
MAQAEIHLSNGDAVTTNMFSEIEHDANRITCIEEAIKNRNIIRGVYTSRLGTIILSKIMICEGHVVSITIQAKD